MKSLSFKWPTSPGFKKKITESHSISTSKQEEDQAGDNNSESLKPGPTGPAEETRSQAPQAPSDHKDHTGSQDTMAGGEQKDSESPSENNSQKQVVHTKSISIKDALRGVKRKIPLADEEIGEADQVVKSDDLAKEGIELSAESVVKHWNAYAETLKESQPRIYNTLIENQPELTSEGGIMIMLTSNAQRDNFIQRIRPGLIEYLKEHLLDMDYDIEARVRTEKGNEKKTIYTDQDKLEYLVKKNPVLEKYRKNLKLDFDD